MGNDELGDRKGDSQPKPQQEEAETVLPHPPQGQPASVEMALAQYAESIERLGAASATEMDPYTRGFVAGLRAAIKVAASVMRE